MNLVPRLPAHAADTIAQFLRAHVEQSGSSGVVVGMSGGIDSCLAARMARDALGAERVTGVLLPDRSFPRALAEETESYGRALGVAMLTLAIDGIEGAAVGLFPPSLDRDSVGNIKARARMLVLYTVGRGRRALVLGTGNKSELLLGYFTKYGDGGADLLPLGDLYKTEVRELARELGLPKEVLDRAPTAGLWEGQTDEGELGLPYVEIDRILLGMEELRSEAEIARLTGLGAETVRAIVGRVERNRHKRRMPPIPKLSLRTIGVDWKE